MNRPTDEQMKKWNGILKALKAKKSGDSLEPGSSFDTQDMKARTARTIPTGLAVKRERKRFRPKSPKT
jgi:hypothetical protein